MLSVFIAATLSFFNAQSQQLPQTYDQAYQLCSPAANELTKQQCGFAGSYEHYYTDCMTKYGFHDDDQVTPGYYEKYMQAYNYCSSIADSSAKQNCNYGDRFKVNYDNCMIQYGFDQQGDQVTPQKPKNDDGSGYFQFRDFN